MAKKRILCALLGALMLLGCVPSAAFAAQAGQREEPTAFSLGNASETILTGGGRSVTAGDVLYYIGEADGFVYRFDGEQSVLVCPMQAQYLNYINGALWFASADSEDSFTVYRCDPESFDAVSVLAAFPGTLKQLYVTSDGALWFAVDETIWRMAEGGEPEAVRTADELWSFVPTQYGPIYACGALFNYHLYFNGKLLVKGAMSYYVEFDGEPRLVYNLKGEDLQLSLCALAAGERTAEAFTGCEKEAVEVLTAEEEAALFEREGEVPTVEQMPEQTREPTMREALSRPATPGMIKTALRAYQMTDVKWTPVKDIRGWTRDDGRTVIYKAGTTYHGIPYGWPYDVGGYVPWSKSLERFVNATANADSDFYTKRSGVRNGLCYANDCSGFVSWAWNTSSRQTCTGLRSQSYCMLVSSSSIAGAEIGDALICSSHTKIITNIKYNSAGTITAIEIAEANPTPGLNFNASRFWYGEGGSSSLSSISWHFNSGYRLYRNANRENVRFEESPAVSVSHDTPMLDTSNKAESHLGVDVSEWNGVIDWATASQYVEFAIIRVGRSKRKFDENGKIIDVEFARDDEYYHNVEGCEKYHIPYGIYYYANAVEPEQAMKEAGWVLEETVGKNHIPDLPIFYDVEEENGNLALSNDKLYTVVSGFCTLIEDMGLHAGVYTSLSYMNTKFTDSRYAKWCTWVAQYFRYCQYEGGMNMWQYSGDGGSGRVPGIGNGKTSVDMDYWYGDLGNWTYKYVMSQYGYCSVPGYNLYRSTDGQVSWTEEIAPLGHVFSDSSDVCLRCGLTRAEAASETAFVDVYRSDWYYDAVQYAVKAGLFNGTSTYTFSPNDTMTRAMMVTVLYRLAGAPETEAENPFEDVPDDAYYHDPVVWAYELGVVNGVSETLFSPGSEITREQMAAMLNRYTKTTGVDMGESAALSGFPDEAETSDWAVEPLGWAVGVGLINGIHRADGDYLAPGGNATRAQVATILMRYQEKYSIQHQEPEEPGETEESFAPSMRFAPDRDAALQPCRPHDGDPAAQP